METWRTITVELVEGRGVDWWPRPGRVLLTSDAMTLRDVAAAIDSAFARWDRAHLHRFVLPDRSQLVPVDWWDGDPPREARDDADVTVGELEPGSAFVYEFDLGDRWTHLCTVGRQAVDPDQVLGIRPTAPLPCAGWGSVPDQYGREHRDDDGATPVPPQPDPPTSDLPALLPHWGPDGDDLDPTDPDDERVGTTAPLSLVPPLDEPWSRETLGSLRAAVRQDDVEAVLAAVAGRDVGTVAHHVGGWLAAALLRAGEDDDVPQRGTLTSLAAELHEAVADRDGPGDAELAELLAAALAGASLPLEPTPVRLDEISLALDGYDGEMTTWLDLDTGQFEIDDAYSGMGRTDEELEASGHVAVTSWTGRNEGWHDMATFVDTVDDDQLRERLHDAIHGRGAFRRFGDVVHADLELRDAWEVHRAERELGRARAWLAKQGRRAAD